MAASSHEDTLLEASGTLSLTEEVEATDSDTEVSLYNPDTRECSERVATAVVSVDDDPNGPWQVQSPRRSQRSSKRSRSITPLQDSPTDISMKAVSKKMKKDANMKSHRAIPGPVAAAAGTGCQGRCRVGHAEVRRRRTASHQTGQTRNPILASKN